MRRIAAPRYTRNDKSRSVARRADDDQQGDRARPASPSTTKFELLDEPFVVLGILVLQIVQKSAALTYEFEQAPPRVMVVLVDFEVLSQTPNSFRQQGNLDFG